MENNEKALLPEGPAKPAQTPRRIYESLPHGRLLLAGTLALCLLLVDALGWPWGLGSSVTVFAGYLFLLLAAGREAMFRRRESRALLVVNLALAATFALGSNLWFHWWNFLALLVLIPVHAVALSGGTLLPWWKPAMLWERFLLLFWGLFGNLGAAIAEIFPASPAGPEGSAGERKAPSRTLPLVLGACGALVLVSVLIPILASADALFAAALEDLRLFSLDSFAIGLNRLFWACVMTPFVFSFVYSLHHPKPLKACGKGKTIDALLFVLMLAAVDVLYLAFLAVQSAGLFGGPEYLAARGLSYAEWARSGFFQMVGVTIVNLTVVLTALTFSRREGQSWLSLRALSALLAGESLVLLASAAWRMTLYVSAYGLSFKRCMTYWGMVMMALFFLTALWKIRKPDFGFCRLAFPLALAGWLLINCVPVDYLVARDQVDRCLAAQALGGTPSISVGYLLDELSYDTLSQLARLDSGTLFFDRRTGRQVPLGELLQRRRAEARAECADWRSWTLSACLAAGGGPYSR